MAPLESYLPECHTSCGSDVVGADGLHYPSGLFQLSVDFDSGTCLCRKQMHLSVG